MSFLANLLFRGHSMTEGQTPAARFGLWLGRRLALRHAAVHLGERVKISPAAMINPRGGSIEIGSDSTVGHGAAIQGNVRIGEFVSVQACTLITGYGSGDEPGRVTIGSNTRIAAHCMLIAGNHIFDDPERPIRKQGIRPGLIVIGEDVWLGGGVHVMAGVTIGDHCVVGAGAVVTHDLPPGSIAAGIPARVIRSRGGGEKGIFSTR